MKKALLVSTAVLLIGAGAAMAHGPWSKGGHFGGRHGGGYHHGMSGHEFGGPRRRGDHKMKRGRRGAGVEKQFEALDADSNGEVTAEEIAAAKAERFAAMDTNGDGSVDAREMVEYRMLQRAERRIKRLDKNEDGVMQADELPDRNQRLTRFDLDNNGTITRAELDLVAKHMGSRGGRRWRDRDDRRGPGGEAPAEAPEAAPSE